MSAFPALLKFLMGSDEDSPLGLDTKLKTSLPDVGASNTLMDLDNSSALHTERPEISALPAPEGLKQTYSDIIEGKQADLDARREKLMADSQAMRDPARRQALQDKVHGNVFENIMQGFGNFAALTPRGGKIGSHILGAISGGKEGAQKELNKMDSAAHDLSQEATEADKLYLDYEKSKREGVDWDLKNKIAKDEADPTSNSSRLAQFYEKEYKKLTPEMKALIDNTPADRLKSAGPHTLGLRAASEKERQNELRQQELALNREDKQRQKEEADSAGQKKLDSEFAKEYSNWRAEGGFATVQSDINKIRKEVLPKLDPDNKSANRFSGIATKIPIVGEIVSPDKKALQENIASVIQKTARQIMGPQYTQQEGQNLIDRAYNSQLSDAENYKRVDQVLKEMEARSAAKERSANHFEQHGGTLKGLNDGTQAPGVLPSKSVGGVIYEKKADGKWYQKK